MPQTVSKPGKHAAPSGPKRTHLIDLSPTVATPAPKASSASARHRQVAEKPLGLTSRKVVRSTVILSSLAVAATGAAIVADLGGNTPTVTPTVGIDTAGGPIAGADAGSGIVASPNAAQLADDLARRATSVSRSAQRTVADPRKSAALASVTRDLPAVTHTEDLADEDPRTIGAALLSEFGWGQDQFGCLDSLWTRESNWNPHAENSSSGAFGIPQSLPGSKMASVASDWATNPVTQIKWGLGYIQERYGSPCGAWGHSESYGWY